MGEITGYEQDLEAVKEYYANLLILQYRNKPKARETVKIGAEIYLGDGLIFQFQDLLDADKAKGKWLDLIGKIVGAPRTVPGVGTLTDEEYRVLIKFKILFNVQRASIKQMNDALYELFRNEIILANNQDLTINYIVSESIEKPLLAALILGYITSPIGVEIGDIIQVPDTLKIFGFNTKYMQKKAIGLSTKNQLRQGAFLDKNNILDLNNNL